MLRTCPVTAANTRDELLLKNEFFENYQSTATFLLVRCVKFLKIQHTKNY